MKKTAKQIAAEVINKVAQINQVKTLPRKTKGAEKNPLTVGMEPPSTPNAEAISQ